MLYLLRVEISGYKMLEDNFLIDFVTKAKVSDPDLNKEVIEIDENLYTFSTIALTGSNSSGKTTTLELLHQVLFLLKTGRWRHWKRDFLGDFLSLRIVFYLNGEIYDYSSKILAKSMHENIEIHSPYAQFKEETIKVAKYRPTVGRRYLKELKFEVLDKMALPIDDTSILALITKESFSVAYITPFANNPRLISSRFFNCLNYFNDDMMMSIIQLFDDSIENLKYASDDIILFKRYNMPEIAVTKYQLLSLLSNGTIKGIELYVRIIRMIKSGGIILIDEIENCFHKNLVSNILFLMTDKGINVNKAQIIFSTHYVEILDIFDRRDNIFILKREKNSIKALNLYENYPIRTDILKSRQFNNNTFGTLLNYERLMQVKRKIKHEISNND